MLIIESPSIMAYQTLARDVDSFVALMLQHLLAEHNSDAKNSESVEQS